MKEAAAGTEEPAAARVRRMRIARNIAERMMLAMRGAPFQRRLLHRQGAHHRPEHAVPTGSRERTMREQAVVADRNTQTGREIDRQEEDQLSAGEPSGAASV